MVVNDIMRYSRIRFTIFKRLGKGGQVPGNVTVQLLVGRRIIRPGKPGSNDHIYDSQYDQQYGKYSSDLPEKAGFPVIVRTDIYSSSLNL